MFHRQEVPLPRLGQHAREEGLRDIAIQQALPVLRERRRVPDRLVHVQPDEPAEQQVVIQLLHQLPLTAHREEHLQQQGPQQFLRRDRGAANLRIEFGERGRQLMQHRVHHAPDHAQRMVLRDARFRGEVAKHAFLLPIVSAHRGTSEGGVRMRVQRDRVSFYMNIQIPAFSSSC